MATLDEKITQLESITKNYNKKSTSPGTGAVGSAIIAPAAATAADYAYHSALETSINRNVQTNSSIDFNQYYNSTTGEQIKQLPSETETFPGFVNHWVTFLMQSATTAAVAVNLLNTYMEYKQATTGWEKTKKIGWGCLHLGVGIASYVYSKTKESITSVFSGLSQGNAVNDGTATDPLGAAVTLGALLFEGSCFAASMSKLSKKNKTLDKQEGRIDKLYNQCLKGLRTAIIEYDIDVTHNNDLTFEDAGMHPNATNYAKVIFSKYPELIKGKKSFKPVCEVTGRDYDAMPLTLNEISESITRVYDKDTAFDVLNEFENAGISAGETGKIFMALYAYGNIHN